MIEGVWVVRGEMGPGMYLSGNLGAVQVSVKQLMPLKLSFISLFKNKFRNMEGWYKWL
jgi:hypothetical protein